MRSSRVAPALAIVVLLFGLAVPAGAQIPSTGPVPGVPADTAPSDPDVTYGSSGGRPLLLDVYRPAGDPPPGGRPAVLLVHGGGWLAGDKAAVQREGAALAAQGLVGFGIGYDMVTEPHFPTELANLQSALRWVQDHAADYGVDRNRIGVFGGSAGGNLAMLLGTDGPGVDGYAPVRAVVSWSGPADLRTLAVTLVPIWDLKSGTLAPNATPVACSGDPNCFGMLAPDLLYEYLGCSYNTCPWTYGTASPATRVGATSPPMLLAGSEQDFVPMDQNYLMANALNDHGIRSELLLVPGDRHADAYIDVALLPSIAFLQASLAAGADPRVAPRSPPTTVAGSAALPALVDGWRLPGPTPDPPWLMLLVIGSIVLVLGSAVVVVRAFRRR